MKQVSQSQYNEVRENPSILGSFLREIDLEGYQEYVREVRPGFHSDEKILMESMINPFSLSLSQILRPSKPRKSDIIVYPSASKSMMTVENFLSALIDHECFHAKENYQNAHLRKQRFSPLGGALAEIRAYENQIKNFRARGVTPEYRKMIKGIYSKYQEALPKLRQSEK